jgi:hypothetical protein
MEISPNERDRGNNFLKCRDKIRNQISYWERFRLSLPGRLTIAKIFMISQLNYLGCFYAPNPDILNEIQIMLTL